MTIFKTAKEIISAYNNGLDGIVFDERTTDEILSENPNLLFKNAASSGISDSGKGKLALPYKWVMDLDPEFGGFEPQKTGDCTSHGTRNATTGSLVCDIKQRFDPESFRARLATEAIYGARRHAGEGMAVIFAVQYLQKFGIALRQKYGKYDLSNYNPALGIKWGGQGGAPKEVTDETKNNLIEGFALIESVSQARDSLYNGYCLTVGSNYGFGNKRDKNGIVRKSGSWGHCMCWLGMDDTKQRSSETLFLIINSWGVNWISGPKALGQPEGSFWITESDAQGMLNQKQAYAISNVNGFPSKDLNWSILDEVL